MRVTLRLLFAAATVMVWAGLLPAAETNSMIQDRGPMRDEPGDVLAQFNLPFLNNAGLAWDGQWLWGTCRTNQRRLYAMETENYRVVRTINLNISDAIGMTWDPVDRLLWVCEYVRPNERSIAHLYDRDGNRVRQVLLPRGGHHGLACDGRYIYANSENDQQDHRIYKLERDGRVVAQGPNLQAAINHGRAVSLEYVPAHDEGHFWVMSVGFISQVAVDFENNRARVIREFRSNNTDYPHQGLAHDGYALFAGGRWDQQIGYKYDDGLRETYGVLDLAVDEVEMGPTQSGAQRELPFRIYNRSEQQDELHVLRFGLSDFGEGADWLSADPEAGEIEALDSTDVTLTASTEDLQPGDYERTLEIRSNDPANRRLLIPVRLSVVEGVGRLFGTVRAAADDQPLPGARVFDSRYIFAAVTDEEGRYEFADFPEWEYELTVMLEDYLTQVRGGIEIQAGGDREENFALQQARFRPDPPVLELAMQTDSELQLPLRINNDGDGPLSWHLSLEFPDEAEITPWALRRVYNVGEQIQNNRIGAVAFADEHLYVASGHTGDARNLITVLSRDGEVVRQFPQITNSNFGLRDLAWDGTLLWGVDEGRVMGFTTAGELEREFQDPLRPSRCITFDPVERALYLGNITSDILKVDRDGRVLARINRPGPRVYGLAWYAEDPDGYPLYLFHNERDVPKMVSKVQPQTGRLMQVTTLEGIDGDAVGASITGQWDPLSWTAAVVIDGDVDRLGVWQVSGRTGWIGVEPMEGITQARAFTDLELAINTLGLVTDVEYTTDMAFQHDGVARRHVVPVSVLITDVGGISQRAIAFGLGWNLVSVNVRPEPAELRQIFAPLIEQDLLHLMKDGQGRLFYPAGGVDQIGEWDASQGYWVRVLTPVNLLVGGEVLAGDSPIPLVRGWNAISYLPRRPTDARVALSGLGENLDICKDGRGNFYLPRWEFNGLGSMREGSGYMLKVREDADLIYRMDDGVAEAAAPLAGADLNWIRQQPQTSASLSLLVVSDRLPAGMRLRALSASGRVVGRGVANERSQCGIAVWGSATEYDNSIGLTEGETFAIQYKSGEEWLQAPLTWLQGEAKYTPDAVAVARLGDIINSPQVVSVECYPNPFNDLMTVRVNVSAADRARVAVFDLQGRLAAELHRGALPAGSHRFAWRADGFAAGVYILAVQSGRLNLREKVLLLK